MELHLPVAACLCLLTWAGVTRGDGNGPAVISLVVDEDSDVILPCSFGSVNIKGELFDWKRDAEKEVFMYSNGDYYNNGLSGQDKDFRGRVFHFPEQLESGNASIVIRNTKVTDSGNYTCDFPHHRPKGRSRVSLLVGPILKDRSDENIPGAAPKPSFIILNQTEEGVLLQCEVNGASPKPEVEWKDSSGNTLHGVTTRDTVNDRKYDITLVTTVNKAGYYRCVSTQQEIFHQIYTETYVYPIGAAIKPVVTVLKTDDEVLLQCEVQGASAQTKVEWQDSSGSIVPAKRQITERGGSYDIILLATATKSDNFRCVSTQEGNDQPLYAETYVPPIGSPPETGFTGSIVAAVLGTLIVGAVLVGIVLAALRARGYKFSCKKDSSTSARGKEEEALNQPA